MRQHAARGIRAWVDASDVLDRVTDGVVLLDRDWRVVYMNPAAERVVGEPAGQVVGRVQWEKWPIALGTEMERRYRHAMAAGEPTHFEQHFAGGRREVWLEIHAYPSADSLAVFFRDVTERKVATERTWRLQRVTAALSSALTPEQVVNVVVEQGIGALQGRAGAVFRISDDGSMLELAGAIGYQDGDLDPWRRLPLAAPIPVAEAVRTGTPVFLTSASEWSERFPETGPLRMLHAGESWAAVPLVAGKRVLGAIGISFPTRHTFDDQERAFKLTLAHECALALERARLYAEAESARAAAERANDAKSQFLATMSHEIRTPINAIQGYTQLMELGIAGPVTDHQRLYLGRLAGSATHLLGLIDDVLDLAKVDAGELTVASMTGIIDVASRTALELTGPLAAARGVRLVDQCGTGVAYVGDDHRVRQILINLLSNGVKFTSAGGRVTISCGTAVDAPPEARLQGQGPWAFIRVEDTGVGIPPEEMANVFEAFHQVERGRTRTQGGTGLGLTISLRLARLMHGDLTIESTPGVGSAFTLWLPSPGESGAEQEQPAGVRASHAELETTIETPGLRSIGELLRDELDTILATYVERLRADPSIPHAGELHRSQLEDHTVSLLADIAQSLVIIAEAGAEAHALLADSARILRSIAEAHGARRQAQGWREAALGREYEILREVVEQTVRARMPADASDATTATHTLADLLRQAEASSRRAWKLSAEGKS